MMTAEILNKHSSNELQCFFEKEFECLLIRILTKLDIQIAFPAELEELILSIPEDETFFDECQNVYSIISSRDNIKSHIQELIETYQNLLKIEKNLSCKR
ncbi:MAG: hypothetical protein Q4D02_03620 [Clostridia bacterium]|nr:hypothetical protein [Clostridia bacterium]